MDSFVCHNFQYYIDVDYDRDDHPDEYDDGYGRNSTIEDAHVEGVNMVSIREKVMLMFTKKDKEGQDLALLSYCIDRIIRIKKLYELSVWEVNITDGYYGEEIDSVHLELNLARELDEVFLTFRKAGNKIEFLLNLEYGYVPHYLEDKVWVQKAIRIEKVDAGQKDHLRKCVQDRDNPYTGITCVVGVVLPIPGEEGRYKLYDGYHRYSAAKNAGDDSVIVYVGLDKGNL